MKNIMRYCIGVGEFISKTRVKIDSQETGIVKEIFFLILQNNKW